MMLGRKLNKDEEIEVNLEVTEEVPEMIPFKSNKTQIGVLSSWGLTLFSYVAVYVLGFSLDEVKIILPCVTAIICCHLIGYAITDASASFGKGKTK